MSIFTKIIICIYLVLIADLIYAQVPNGDFENWNTVLNQHIHSWLSVGKVSAETNSMQGPYAVKIEQDSVNHSTSLLLHGGYVNGVGFVGGVPYAERPDSIKGFFKCYSPHPFDVAVMQVIFKKNNVNLSSDYFFIGVSADTSVFQEKKFKINYTNPTEIPDSVIILLTNPNPFQDSLYNGYLIADNLSFTNAVTPIPNGNFDGWTITQIDNPQEFMSYNFVGLSTGNFPVSRTADCISGNSAVKMQNILGTMDTVPGIIVSSVGGAIPQKAFPITERYTSFKGSYKYFPENQDSMLVLMFLYKSDTLVGFAQFLNKDTASTYASFDVPIFYWDNFFEIPDSALIYAAAYKFDNGSPRGNSVLYLDNLHLIINNQIVINEFVSSNASVLFDNEGDAEDWIELYNAGPSPVVLNNYFLSDDLTTPNKWRMPMILLEPDSFLVVYASGKDRYYPDLETNFQISQTGEPLTVSNPMGNVINTMPAKELATDVSFGRFPDASANFYFFAQPTPHQHNSNNTFMGFTDMMPVFSYPPGFYTDSIYLNITCANPNAVIRYTLDGSEPKPFSPQFTMPLLIKSRTGDSNTISMISSTTPWWGGWQPPQGEIFKSNVVRAKAFINDTISVKTATSTYFVDDSIFSRYNMPVLSMVSDNVNLFDYVKGIYVMGKIYDDYVQAHPNDTNLFTPANYFIRGDAGERPVHVEFFEHDGTFGFSQDAGLRTHGGASRMFRQKALRLYARSKYSNEFFEYPIFPHLKKKATQQDLTRFRNLILRTSGNDNDLTFFRDGLVHTLVTHTTADVMALQPSAVFLNGEFWGIHNFRERQDKYYFEAHYGVDPDSVTILETNANVTEGADTSNQHYINMLLFINSHDITDSVNYAHVKTMMDIDNFIDYETIEIYIRNTDWPGNNIRFWRKNTPQYMPNAPLGNDGRWRWIVYDTDFGFGMQDGLNAPTHNTLEFATDSDNISWPNPSWSTFLFRTLLKNTDFRNSYINRTADHINTTFKPQRVLDVIDSLQAIYEYVMPEHIYRWYTNGDIAEWYDNINVLRNFAIFRPANIQQHIINKWNLPGKVNVTLDVSDASHGSVKISSLLINENTKGIVGLPYPWTGTYFKDIPIPVKAIPKIGYVFVKWEGTNITTPEITLTLTGDTALKALFEPDTTYQHVSLYINEVMAVNNSFIADENGEYDDWIEIYNAGSDTVDIEGYFLTDDLSNTTKYTLPSNNASSKIAPHGFLLLWADDSIQQGALHLPFKLSTNGESIGLFAPNQTLKDTLTFGYQLGNHSWGRYPDASPNLIVFDTPTPNASNTISNNVNQVIKDNSFYLFPNPANNMVYFNKTTDIELYNSYGQLVFKKDNVHLLNVSTLEKGIYYIREKENAVVKLVIF